jgi:ABC-type Fe3+ transport system permease subunit
MKNQNNCHIAFSFQHNVPKQTIEFLYVLYYACPTMHLALAYVIRARHKLYVYYISDVKFLGYVLTTLFAIILFNFA